MTWNCTMWREEKSIIMNRTENVELTVLCLIQDGDRILLQNRVKKDWEGYTLPGGHVEPGESFVDAVKREMKEETGLDIINPRLAGIKQFPIENGRYIVIDDDPDEYKTVLPHTFFTDAKEGFTKKSIRGCLKCI